MSHSAIRRLRIGGLLILFVALSLSASAQGTLGRLVGSVVDPQGAALPGATATLTSADTGFTATRVSTSEGAFAFEQLPVGKYELVVELSGFAKSTYRDVTINVGQEYSLTARMSLATVQESVEVTAGVSLLKTTTPEVSATLQQRQILDMPLAGREVVNLIKTQAGVAGISNRQNSVINGGRPTWTQITVDGINVQDNFIRANGVDFLPNRPTSDMVAEFTVTTSVQGADQAGGASSVRMVTPSGTNTLRGSIFEFNRDSALSANAFFNNSAGLPKPNLKRNQFGGRVGGPIVRNKLFFFGYYEGYRQSQQINQNLTIPANADFGQGVFRYVGLDNVPRSVNVLQLSGLPADPRVASEVLSKLPSASLVNNFDTGNSRAGLVLNTAGYRFNQTSRNTRDQYGIRLDHTLNSSNRFEGIYSSMVERNDRDDLDIVSPDRPQVYTKATPRRFAGAWRSTVGTGLSNELRGGGNLAGVSFDSDWDFSSGVLYNTVLSITNPIGGNGTSAAFMPQGRVVNTYQMSDNATWAKGDHQFQFGGSFQRNKVNPYNYAGQFPTVTFGFSPAAPTNIQLTSAQFPGGIAPADLTNANNMLAWLSGITTSVSRTFQVRNASSGYVPGIPSNENYTLDNATAYAQDNWRVRSNLTIRAGLKWEYFSPLRERDNLGFLPTFSSGQGIDQVMLDPNARVTFANGDFYKKDLNNFGPNVGFAWDLTKDGRTAVRGGYSLTFVNEDAVTVGRSAARGNAGLSTTVNLTNQFATVNAGIPQPATPAFLSTRALSDQLALNANGVLWGIDPNLRQPSVHQMSVGIQRDLGWKTAVEARYVGTLGRNIWRGTDYNQLTVGPDFLADFNRARSNGYLAQAAGLAFSPVFNPAVPGSQPLTVLPNFGAALLTNATVISNIQTNAPAGLADFYITNRVPGALATFMQNPGIYAAQAIVNGAFSDYHALQLELRRQLSNGFLAQANYTLSKTNTNSPGTAQNRLEAFLDNNRPELSTGRSPYQQTHVLQGNAVYELPFGRGHRWLANSTIGNAILGNWQVAANAVWQSGSPISFFSGRASFNRVGRSNCDTAGALACNTALTSLSVDELKALLGVYRTPDGRLFWIDPKVVDPQTGRGVGPDNLGNTAGYPGQVFFNPVAGQVGNLPVLGFDGPPQTRVDMALTKRVGLPGRYRLEFKGEAFNLFNTPSFLRGDININSTTFGRLTSVNVDARVIQLSARFDF